MDTMQKIDGAGAPASAADGKVVYFHHYESSAFVKASAEALFRHVDNPARLSTHMRKSSWMMGGSRLEIVADRDGGQRIGSRIRMGGRVLGVSLSLDEAITERDPPRHKARETIGQPQLLVIGRYRMGFDIVPQGGGSQFHVFIDYDPPASTRWLGRLFGQYYARWCTRRMVSDAVKHFSDHEH